MVINVIYVEYYAYYSAGSETRRQDVKGGDEQMNEYAMYVYVDVWIIMDKVNAWIISHVTCQDLRHVHKGTKDK